MPDSALIREILTQMLEAIRRIERRISYLTDPNEFITTDIGIDRLDAVCMMLIALGESAKYLDKITGGSLLAQYPQTDWKGVKGIRDIISHHYFDVNPKIVYSVCKVRIPQLKSTLEQMLQEME